MFDLLSCSYLVSLELRCVRDREELGINPGFCPLVHSKGYTKADQVETVMLAAQSFSSGGAGIDWVRLWRTGILLTSGFGGQLLGQRPVVGGRPQSPLGVKLIDRTTIYIFNSWMRKWKLRNIN